VKVLITGRGTSGSWRIRGEQLGAAIGATVKANATDVERFDLVVVVKRATPELLLRIHRAGVPLVWDVVDAWTQPYGNLWDARECRDWLKFQVGHVRPAAIVAATYSMAVDLADYGVPVLTLRHHARPGLRANPIRRTLQAVGYEGGVAYLGAWMARLEAECARRRMRFVLNPSELADLDVVIALRDAMGYAPRCWKSNVKLANAQGSGTPIICNREAGYRETASGAEEWADTMDEVRVSLDMLDSIEVRRARADVLLAAAPTLERVAAEYQLWLSTLPCLTAPRS
jgi:hypothetical protein